MEVSAAEVWDRVEAGHNIDLFAVADLGADDWLSSGFNGTDLIKDGFADGAKSARQLASDSASEDTIAASLAAFACHSEQRSGNQHSYPELVLPDELQFGNFQEYAPQPLRNVYSMNDLQTLQCRSPNMGSPQHWSPTQLRGRQYSVVGFPTLDSVPETGPHPAPQPVALPTYRTPHPQQTLLPAGQRTAGPQHQRHAAASAAYNPASAIKRQDSLDALLDSVMPLPHAPIHAYAAGGSAQQQQQQHQQQHRGLSAFPGMPPQSGSSNDLSSHTNIAQPHFQQQQQHLQPQQQHLQPQQQHLQPQQQHLQHQYVGIAGGAHNHSGGGSSSNVIPQQGVSMLPPQQHPAQQHQQQQHQQHPAQQHQPQQQQQQYFQPQHHHLAPMPPAGHVLAGQSGAKLDSQLDGRFIKVEPQMTAMEGWGAMAHCGIGGGSSGGGACSVGGVMPADCWQPHFMSPSPNAMTSHAMASGQYNPFAMPAGSGSSFGRDDSGGDGGLSADNITSLGGPHDSSAVAQYQQQQLQQQQAMRAIPPVHLARLQASGGQPAAMRKSHSALELNSWRGGIFASAADGSLETHEPGKAAVKLSPEERLHRILRYRQKRDARNFQRTIKYQCRKTLADTRPRVNGRFARNDEPGSVMPHETKKAQRERQAREKAAAIATATAVVQQQQQKLQQHLQPPQQQSVGLTHQGSAATSASMPPAPLSLAHQGSGGFAGVGPHPLPSPAMSPQQQQQLQPPAHLSPHFGSGGSAPLLSMQQPLHAAALSALAGMTRHHSIPSIPSPFASAPPPAPAAHLVGFGGSGANGELLRQPSAAAAAAGVAAHPGPAFVDSVMTQFAPIASLHAGSVPDFRSEEDTAMAGVTGPS